MALGKVRNHYELQFHLLYVSMPRDGFSLYVSPCVIESRPRFWASLALHGVWASFHLDFPPVPHFPTSTLLSLLLSFPFPLECSALHICL